MSQVSAYRLPRRSQVSYSAVFLKEVHVRQLKIRQVMCLCLHHLPVSEARGDGGCAGSKELKPFSPQDHLKIQEFGHLLSLQSHW